MSAALAGLRVLDLTRVLSGPFGTMMLADLGADVVKVEGPAGDDTRSFGPPFVRGHSTYFVSINRGKRSVVADLRAPEGRALVRRLALAADVLIENFRPGVAEAMGLGAEDLMAAHPRLVHCSIAGFRPGDPRPGYDLITQGLSGIPSITGEGDPPWKCGASIADLVAGFNAAQGILAALLQRERTGRGARVHVSMLDGQLALLTWHASAWLNAGVAPRATGNAHPSIHPFRAYRAADGWINLAVGSDGLFRRLCEALGQRWHEDPRFATNPDRVRHRAALDALLEPLLAGRAVADWETLLEAAGVPAGGMLSVPEALRHAALVEHEHPSGEGVVRTPGPALHIDGAPQVAARRPPRQGEHLDEVLADWLGDVSEEAGAQGAVALAPGPVVDTSHPGNS